MLAKELLIIAEKIAQDFFDKMTFVVDLNLSPSSEDVIIIEVDTNEAQLLIGQQGKTLLEIQQLLGRIMRKQLEGASRVDLDINRYKSDKSRYLVELARISADEVALVGREKILAPMTALERRLVHIGLSSRSDIATESIGEEPERRIVIRPASFLGG